jgi:hypothetical protein
MGTARRRELNEIFDVCSGGGGGGEERLYGWNVGKEDMFSHQNAASTFGGFFRCVRSFTIHGLCLLLGFKSSNLLHQFQVCFIDVGPALRRCLKEGTIIHFSHLLTFLRAHTALSFKIALVSNDDHRIVVYVLHIQNRLAVLIQLFKALSIVHCIDDQETLSSTDLRRFFFFWFFAQKREAAQKQR